MDSVDSRLAYFRLLAEEMLTPERLQHSLGVEALAAELAPKYNIVPDDARLAALVHDLAKGYSLEEQIRRAKELKLIVYPQDIENPQVLHGRLAAYMLEHDYGVGNQDILQAVANHTLGRPNMSPLEMLIYSADLTEPGRDFPGVDKLRQKLYHDLREGTLACVEHTLNYLNMNKKRVHPLTALTYASLKSECDSKEV
ncbi:bis(5'-nucleosyl)-tetraphosphatase (symmetrical) YqeK [Dehalobacter sp. DCM]|nr:bis(5'-nucleosyl)-tetraphosphatase (symmetrical) YqeK [Dehalobacter sp. DCM]